MAEKESDYGEDNSRYREEGYWDGRFKNEDEYEWLCGYDDVKAYLDRDINSFSRKILILGCGNSPFSASCFDAGYENIVSVDFSQEVIEKMRQKYGETHPKLVWHKADVRKLEKYADGAFDCVIDKACLDALVCNEGDPWCPNEETQSDMTDALYHSSRVLTDTGVFISIGFQQPHFRKKYLVQEAQSFGWEKSVETFPVDVGLGYFYTICKKTKTEGAE